MEQLQREQLADKIRALRAKASNVASTEAEAIQAASMIAKILTKYDLTEQDLEQYTGAEAGAVCGQIHEAFHEAVKGCFTGIQELTETTIYADRNKHPAFVGAAHDVETAMYLYEIIASACDRALKAGFPRASRLQRVSFAVGFGQSVNEKLKALASERKAAKTTTGTAIVVAKGALVKSFMDDAGIHLKDSKSKTKVDNGYFNAGKTVGNNMNLNRPLASAGGAPRVT